MFDWRIPGWPPLSFGQHIFKPHLPNAGHLALGLPVQERLQALRFCSSPAVHEAGHTVVAWSSHYVSGIAEIVCNEDEGITRIISPPRKFSASHVLWDLISIDLAGMAAEVLVFGRVSSIRSRDDLRDSRNSATNLANSGTQCPWIDESRLGALEFKRMFKAGRKPSDAANQVLKVCYRRAKAIIMCNHEPFARLTLALYRAGRLNETQIEAALGPRF